MIWYKISVASSIMILILFILSTVLQSLLAMEGKEWIREKRAGYIFSLFYILLAITSLVSAVELIFAFGSIDIGAYICGFSLPRYLSVLPPLLYIYLLFRPEKFPEKLHPFKISFLIPLLRLPQADYLPMPLPAVLAALTAAWFVTDSMRMFWLGRKHEEMDVTRDVLRYIVQNFDYGVLIASRKGSVVESNPSFNRLCQSLGLVKFDRINDIEDSLHRLFSAGILSIRFIENDRLIRKGDSSYYLRCEKFRVRKKTYFLYSLSDITLLQEKVMALEQENIELEKKNQKLENTISNIALEASYQQREKMNRAVHDIWSHKLAVAGLSLDLILKQKNESATVKDLNNFYQLAEILTEEVPLPKAAGLHEVSSILANVYQKLGVNIQTSGEADFSVPQQEVLCHVLREGLANAVRHAYTRQIDVVYAEDDTAKSMVIVNDCLDNERMVYEGRGLHDIKNRIQDAGGTVQYIKDEKFYLIIMFPKNIIGGCIP